jgi:adenosylcobinamide-phosphate synthase
VIRLARYWKSLNAPAYFAWLPVLQTKRNIIMYFSICLLIALLLDRIFGEAKNFHPLVGFGRLATWLEKKLNSGSVRRLKGMLALTLLLAPITALFFYLESLTLSEPIAQVALASFTLYTAIGWQSLREHAQAIIAPLRKRHLGEARKNLARIVSRDTQHLSPDNVASATTESVLENGADAIFSAIFWFIVAGVPGVVLYRLANTLDAMWGYKNSQFNEFGWAAARLDDLMNYLPARMTALSYAICGHTRSALKCWKMQGKLWKSPNAGPVMAAGAGALEVKLGGDTYYDTRLEKRPQLGPQTGETAYAQSIQDALSLINRSLLLWCTTIITIEVYFFLIRFY